MTATADAPTLPVPVQAGLRVLALTNIVLVMAVVPVTAPLAIAGLLVAAIGCLRYSYRPGVVPALLVAVGVALCTVQAVPPPV